jgi:ATP-binding cassette subfamily B protein
LIGEYDLKYIENESLRSVIGTVPQRIDLFAGNVTENIAVGDYQPDMEKIIRICSSLGIMEFIEKLPNNFNTYLGENGAALSAGQKQRLAIARALYREPQILLLDEPTSSLDSTAEQYVQRVIDLFRMQHKTVVIITHRLSSILRADKIVVIEDGVVVEEGNHEELVRNRKKYYELWRQQIPVMGDMIPKS